MRMRFSDWEGARLRLADKIYNKLNDLEKEFNVNFEKDLVLDFCGVQIPNLYLTPLTNLYKNYNFEQHEFIHTLHKIFYLSNYSSTELTYYETKEAQVPNGKIVFDCGANMGIFSAYAAFKGNKVYAFEPSSIARKNLQVIQQINNSIIIIPKGIGAKSETGFLYQADNLAATHRDTYSLNQFNKILYKEQAAFISIDEFCYNTGIFPSYIKADIEGAELDLLQGAKETIQKCSPQLSIAFHENDDVGIAMKLFPEYIWSIQRQVLDESPILIGKRI